MATDRAPVLLLTARSAAHPFDDTLAEVLRTEGYRGFDHHRGRLSAGELSAWPLVICGAGAAAECELETIEWYLAGGGRLILIRPPGEWAPALGLTPAGQLYATVRDAYVVVDDRHPWLRGFPGRWLQIPGEADVHAPAGAEVLARLAGQLGRAAGFAAVSLYQGAAVLAYDLPATLVALQQGRPEMSSTGADPDANRDGKFGADDPFERLRDYRLRSVPQADLHRDLLVRLIRGLTADLLPLPRLWHFPRRAPAALLIDGDSDIMSADDLLAATRLAEDHGGRYTCYLMTEHVDTLSPELAGSLRARGHALGIHPWTGYRPTPKDWSAEIAGLSARFAARFGYRPVSLRSHSCIFPGWDENPRILARHGLRLDTSQTAGYRFADGFLNGSALPLRFVDRDGEVLDCWEQSTVQTEDGVLGAKLLVPPLAQDEALRRSRRWLEALCQRWHGVFHPYFHPVNLRPERLAVGPWMAGVYAEAARLGLPSLNADEWVAFSQARQAVRCERIGWDDEAGRLAFSLAAPEAVAGLTVLLPPVAGRAPAAASLDGAAVELHPVPFEGLGWTAVELDLPAGGEVSLTVDYPTG